MSISSLADFTNALPRTGVYGHLRPWGVYMHYVASEWGLSLSLSGYFHMSLDIRYVKGNFLLGLDVAQMTLEELNGEALRWLRETADVRVHGTTHERPIDRWPAEAAALRSLDRRRDYDPRYGGYRPVTRGGDISYRGPHYSVPPA